MFKNYRHNKIANNELKKLMSEIEIIRNDKECEYNYDKILISISQHFSKENKEKNIWIQKIKMKK